MVKWRHGFFWMLFVDREVKHPEKLGVMDVEWPKLRQLAAKLFLEGKANVKGFVR